MGWWTNHQVVSIFWQKIDSFWIHCKIWRGAIFQAWLQDGEFVRVLDEADATWWMDDEQDVKADDFWFNVGCGYVGRCRGV